MIIWNVHDDSDDNDDIYAATAIVGDDDISDS